MQHICNERGLRLMTGIEDKITAMLGPLAGRLAVVAQDLGDGRAISINSDEVFKSASVIKVPILVELYCQRDEGRLSLDEFVELRDEDKVDGSGVLKELH